MPSVSSFAIGVMAIRRGDGGGAGGIPDRGWVAGCGGVEGGMGK